ncbi:MAG: CDP-alcohol phosphatidyltransferase family protein [Clostridium sp.]|nr:CDP-alcohol phosphatidyltransferase family protein [Prevotella sp.]MCM1428440.1 CDP-alcohol phosphatidyltransferase family protein [Clostridium sp.]
MDIKKEAKSGRDSIQQGIYKIINPFVRLLIRIGFTPNMVTTIGCLGQIAAAAVMVVAGYRASDNNPVEWWMLTLAACLMVGFSLFDMIDGQVARLGNMVSSFGAMYDSILDRYCELFNLGGVIFFFLQTGHEIAAVVAFLALVGSLMVSYVRARAEGLGIECKIGFMQRPERVVTLTLGVVLAGIVGQCCNDLSTGWSAPFVILLVSVSIIAVFANLTAFARIAHCKRHMIGRVVERKSC